MTATASENPGVASFRSRASSFQQILDLEKQYKLERLHNIESNVAQSKAPRAALQPHHPLQVRRAHVLSQQEYAMPHAVRQNVALPSLSISIPSPKGDGKGKADNPRVFVSEKENDSDTENDRQDEDNTGKEGSYENNNDKEVGGALRKSVKFLAPDDGYMSEESSICQSPSWEGYGKKKQEKKDGAKKRKKDRDQAERETKGAKKRLSKAPPVSMQRQSSRSSTPIPLKERSLSAPILGSHQQLSGRGSLAPPSQDKETMHDDTYQVTITSVSGTSSTSGSSQSKVGRLFGGRKGDLGKTSTSSKENKTVTFIPLSYAVMGNIGIGMVARPLIRRPQSLGPGEPSPSARATSESKPARDSCPPSASRTFTLLNTHDATYSRSSSITSSTAVTGPEASSSGWRDMNSTTGSQSSVGPKTSQNSGQGATSTAGRGRQESRGYVRHSREQSAERAMSGLMDEQLVASANSGPRPRRLSLAAEVRAVLRAGFGSGTSKSSSGTATPMEKEPEAESRSDKGDRSGKEDQPSRDASRRTANGQEPDGQPKIRAQTSLDDTVSDYWRFLDESYPPPTLDLPSPTGNPPPPVTKSITQTASASTGTLYYSATSKSDLNLQDAPEATASDMTKAKKTSQEVGKSGPLLTSTQVNSIAHRDERAADLDGAAANSFRDDEKSTNSVSSNVKLGSKVDGSLTAVPKRTRMRPKRASSQEPSVSSMAWISPEPARPSPHATTRSPSAQAYSSTTAVNVSQRYLETPSRRASSSLGFERPSDRQRVSTKIGRTPEESNDTITRQAHGTILKPAEASSSSSTFDDASSLPSPATTPDSSRPQSLKGNCLTAPATVKGRKDVSAASEDEQNEDTFLMAANKSEGACDEHSRQMCDSAAPRSRVRTPLDENWSRSALPIDFDAQFVRSSFANRDGRISRSSLINVEIPLPEMEAPREIDEEELTNLDLPRSPSSLRESLSNPDFMERAYTPDLRRQTVAQQMARERSWATSPDQAAGVKLLSDNAQTNSSRLRTSAVSSANSSVSLASSASTSSAAYLQEARKTAPASSRTSLTPRPPHTGAPANIPRPSIVPKNLPPHSTAVKAPASSDLQRPIAKMFVECCNCHFYHDLPSRLYQCMASPDSIVEDKLLGVSGAITTMVKCPWCAHNMSTKCCAGYAAVVYLKEKLH